MLSKGRLQSCIVFLAISSTGFAQPPEASSFDAASVKPAKRGGGPYSQVSPGRLSLNYYSVPDLIALAYGVRVEQVVGSPFPDRYDIEATADGKTSANLLTGPMLQRLLQDRFHLQLHRETRQLPVYELRIAKGGIKMPATQPGECTRFDPGPPAPPAPARGAPQPPIFFCGYPRTGARGVNRTLDGKGVTMDGLAETLSRSGLDRAVLDQTGLTGAFDVNLKWAVDPSIPGLQDDKSNVPIPGDDTAPVIFSAVQDQLGLRLNAGRGPVEVLVIDHVEKPASN